MSASSAAKVTPSVASNAAEGGNNTAPSTTAVRKLSSIPNVCSIWYSTTEPAARRTPSHGATAAILNGSPPTLTMGVRKLREKLATVTPQTRRNGGRDGSSAMMSHHAQAFARYTTPYSSRIGTNIHPVRTASATSAPAPMRAMR